MSNNKPALPLAIALQYDGEKAPRVTARGSDKLAEQIVQLARQHGIPLQENAPLAAVLSKVELGEEIPESLYLAVAQVIAFAYQLSGKVPKTQTLHSEREA